MLDKSLVNQEIATLIIDTIARKYQLGFLDVNGFSYDRAAPNLAAMSTLSTIYVKGENIPCVSHPVTHVGSIFGHQILQPFYIIGVDSSPIHPKPEQLGSVLLCHHFPRTATLDGGLSTKRMSVCAFTGLTKMIS